MTAYIIKIKIGRACHGGKLPGRGLRAIARGLQPDFGRVHLDLGLNRVHAAYFFGLLQGFSRFEPFLTHAEQLFVQIDRHFGDQQFIETRAHIVEHPLALRLQEALGLSNLLRGSRHIQLQLTGGDDFLSHKRALFAGFALVADLICLIADFRIRPQAYLNVFSPRRINSGRGLRHSRIICQGQGLQVGQCKLRQPAL